MQPTISHFRLQSSAFFISLLLLLVAPERSFPQDFVIEKNYQEMHEKISEPFLADFLGRTLVIPLPTSQQVHIEDYRKMLPRVWKFSPLIVIPFAELKDYVANKDKYAFGLLGFQKLIHRERTDMRTGRTMFYQTPPSANLLITIPVDRKEKGLPIFREISGFEISYFHTEDISFEDGYTRNVWNNFSMPVVMAFLGEANYRLEKRQLLRRAYSPDKDLAALATNDTVYIPRELFRNMRDSSDMGDVETLDAYPGPHRIVSNSELHELVMKSPAGKPLFFVHNTNSRLHQLSIYDAMTGRVVSRASFAGGRKPKEQWMKQLYKNLR